jgi:uncharacterized delta-60 repeat protein/uncharacterized repeat protein (TIGR02543 family)
VWTPATQTISYAAGTSGNGNGPSTPTTALYGSTFTTPANTFTRIGHTFAGWTDSINTYAAGVTYPASGVVVTGNVTLTATWTPNSFTISYARGGTGATGTHPSSPTTALFGSTFPTPANPYSRPGFIFAGWSDGSTTYTAGSTYPASGTVAANVTLTATWSAITYSITYYDTNSGSGNGGDGGSAPATQTGSGASSVLLSANTLILDGYGFYGWTSTNGSTTVEYTNTQTVQLTANTTLNLYPVWGVRTFGTQVGLGASGQTNAAAVQSDGKIVVVGSFLSWNGNSINHVLRLNSDGTRDTAFNASLGSGPVAGQDSVLIQSNQQIVISGTSTPWNGSTATRLVRLNTDGSLDTTFHANIGAGPDNSILGHAQQSDGKLIFVGQFANWNGTSVRGIVRLNTDGTLDTSFINDVGVGLGTPASNNLITSVGLQSDGRIIVAGSFANWDGVAVGRIARLNTNGTRDTTFNQGGTGLNSFVYGARVQSDDAIVLVGNFSTHNGSAASKVLRLNSNGTLDASFSTNIGTSIGHSSTPYVGRVAIQNDGKILIGQGFTTWSGTTVGSLVRLNSNGTRDTAFSTAIGNSLTVTQVLSIVPNGNKAIVLGTFTSWNGTPVGRIVRLNADGTID